MAGIQDTLLGIFGGIGSNVVSNLFGAGITANDRYENYRYGELQAKNADARTRALYKDFYSPEALTRQYQEAGLSPGMMYGGTPGQGGMSGAQGASAASRTPFTPMSLLEGAQIANIAADTKVKEAEAKNINKDTDLKKLEEEWNSMANGQYKMEYQILNTWWITDSGKETSLYEVANECFTYEEFLKEVREGLKKSNLDTEIIIYTQTEQGQKTLRSIFYSANRFNADITTLSEVTLSSNFQQDIINALNDQDFAKLNAQQAVQYLKQSIQSEKLTEKQKKAWNNILDRIGKKGSTWEDIAIVLGMIVNQGLSHWQMPSFSRTNDTNNSYGDHTHYHKTDHQNQR